MPEVQTPPTGNSQGELSGRAKLTDRIVIHIRTVYPKGQTTIGTLALTYRVSYRTLFYALHGYTWRHLNEIAPPIKAKAKTRLDPDKVRSIREKHRQGISTQKLATEYGVHRTTIQTIVSRKHWKHVD